MWICKFDFDNRYIKGYTQSAFILQERNKIMKRTLKLLVVAGALLSLSACMGVRGYQGSQKVCENETFLGISLIEVFSPCR